MSTSGEALACGADARRRPPASDAAQARAARRPAALARIAGRDWLALASLLALAAAIRIPDLGAGGIWLDEGYSLLQSERSLGAILALRTYDANPPLYLLVLHVWRSAFGPGPLAAKSLSLVAGLLGVALVWLAARARFGSRAALCAGLIVALSRFHIHYSQEIRGYALLFALVAAADLCFVRWQAGGRRRDLCGWIVFGFAAVLTHTFAWWVLLVQGALATRRRTALAALAGVLVASSPTLLALAQHVTTFKTQSWIPRPDLDALLHTLWVLGGCGPIAFLVWGLALLGLGVRFVPRTTTAEDADGTLPGWRTAAVPALQLALPFVVFALSLIVTPMLVERYLLISLLPLSCLAGAGLVALRSPVAGALVIATLFVGSIQPIRDQYAQEQRSASSREMADLVRDGYRAGDVVLYTSKWVFVPFVAQHPPGMAEYLLPEITGDEYSTILLGYTSRPVRRTPPERGEYARLWLVRRPDDRPEDIAASDWFRKLEPRLVWQHPSGQLLRFDLDR